MKHCKHCGNPIELTLSGLKGFCSEDCKKAYRKAYMADLMRKKRSVSIRDGYVTMDSQNVSKTNPHEKPIPEGQNDSHGLFEDDFQGFGGKKWHDLAKRECSNFEIRQRKGYCITLTAPYNVFRIPCCECSLGQALATRS